MTTPVAAKFFTLPDGTQSSVQINPATGGPLEVKTPKQFADWDAIQDSLPPSPSQADARLAASMARPVRDAASETDTLGAGREWITERRFAAEAEASTAPLPAPRTKAEHDQRAGAAAQLAESLGLALVWVRDDPAMKVPAHLELRQGGMPYMAGDLTALESALHAMARERARRDEVIGAWEAEQQRKRRETAEAIAATPAARLARLEAALADRGIDLTGV